MKHRLLYRLPIATYLKSIMVKCLLLAALFLPAMTSQAQDEEEVDADTALVAAPVAEEDTPSYQEKVYQAEPPAFRVVPDSAVKPLKRQKDFAYANDPAYWVREPVKAENNGFWFHFYRFFSYDIVRMLMYGLLIAFFLFVIYRVMVVNNLYLFYRNKKSKPVLEDDEAGIEDENLDEKIIRAVHEKQHRMAVRYMYLNALRLLNDRQWIRYHAQTTNYEYVNQMSGHKMGEEFRFLTRIYDYVWYGEFALNEEQFKIVHNNFQQLYNAVK